MAVLEGIAMWAQILAPNERFEHVYTINVVINDKQAKEFAALGHKIRETDMGPSVVIKRKVVSSKGVVNKVPTLVDVNKQPLKEFVGNGSKVRVQYEPWAVTNTFGSFKGLELKAVQVLDLVEYNPGEADGSELGITIEDAF
jgi:hypothetical protein